MIGKDTFFKGDSFDEGNNDFDNGKSLDKDGNSVNFGEDRDDFENIDDRVNLGEVIEDNFDKGLFGLDNDGSLGNLGNFGKEGSSDLEKSDDFGLKRSSNILGGGLAGFGNDSEGSIGLCLSVLILMLTGAWWELIVNGFDFSLRSPVRIPPLTPCVVRI